jgi:hypothetical protein
MTVILTDFGLLTRDKHAIALRFNAAALFPVHQRHHAAQGIWK